MNYNDLNQAEKEFVDELIFLTNLYKRNIVFGTEQNTELYEMGVKLKLYTRRMKKVYAWVGWLNRDEQTINVRSYATQNLVTSYIIPKGLINI